MTFAMLNLMCLDMNLLELLYLEFVEILGLMFFITVWRLWLPSSQLFCMPLSLCLLTSPLCLYWCSGRCPEEHRDAAHSSFFLFLFTTLYPLSLAWRFLILSSSRSDLLLSPLLWIFHCSHCTFQLQSFYLYFFKEIYCFIDILYLMKHQCFAFL